MTLSIPEHIRLDTFDQSGIECPNCGSKGLSVFYSVKNVPVHSCLLMPTRDGALNYPTGDLQLGFCQNCGFITNSSFDSGRQEYSTRYEETQGFSSHFNAFAKSLAQKVIDDYNIHNKTVLEIGCGKGEFLALVCQLGQNHGIGIDPAYVPERNPAGKGINIEFIQDFYSEKYSNLAADVVLCRHTLEHIAPTRRFMQTLRKSIGKRTKTLVIFELPDVMRVLEEGAFWDIYYEHCSYFTTGSLARLFRRSGFDVDQLYLDYDGQYIIITAYPTEAAGPPAKEAENDMEQLRRAVAGFGAVCSAGIDKWRKMIEQFAADGQKTVIWGAGSKGVAFLTTLAINDRIGYAVDINPYKKGKFMPATGHEIVPPELLAEYKPDKVIAMNPVYLAEIRNDLERLNLKPDLLAV